MNSKWVVAFLAAGLCQAAALAQGTLKTNEPVKAELVKDGEVHSWSFEVTKDGTELHFSVECDTGALGATVWRGTERLSLKAVKGRLMRDYYAYGEPAFEARSAKALRVGTYTIKIQGGRPTDGGPYVVRLLSPEFASAKPAAPTAQLPGTQVIKENETLRKENEELKHRIAELERQVKEYAELKRRVAVLEKLLRDK